MLPRYFLAHSQKPVQPLPLTHLLDRVTVEGTERVVAVDIAGQLHLLPADREVLPPALAAELSAQEMLRKPRIIEGYPPYLMEIQQLEAGAAAAGLNDPAVLTGRLFGPDGQAEGRLTLTRADILRGFLEELPEAMEVPAANGGSTRCYHLWLAGERLEELASGCILAYPMVPAELAPLDRGNESLCLELWTSVLFSLQKDLRQQGADHSLARMLLPVADREGLIADWKADGFEIEGDRATQRARGEGLMGKLAATFAPATQRKVPPQATISLLAELTTQALSLFPADARSLALRHRVRKEGMSVGSPRIPARSAEVPNPPAQTQAEPRPAKAFQREKPDWSSDFGPPSRPSASSSRPANTARPQRKPATGPAATPSPAKKPDWMDDFE